MICNLSKDIRPVEEMKVTLNNYLQDYFFKFDKVFIRHKNLFVQNSYITKCIIIYINS